MEDIRNLPIGVFDSGIGGLTVVKSIMERLPNESMIYFGDTARVPYGIKSKETITRFTHEIIRFLMEQKIKLIVVACNTVCASSLETVQEQYPIPMIGVIEPGAKAAVNHTKNNRVGVIGTQRTIDSGAYIEAIHKFNPEIKVESLPCPLFVPLAEEGWTNNAVTMATAKEYLAPLKSKDIDTMVLGCTHYPLLKEAIGEVMGPKVKLVDSGDETALEIERTLRRMQLETNNLETSYNFYVSDAPEKFLTNGLKFLNRPISNVTKILLT